ncbi:MAG: phenylalanine--tRNA ligase subunit beta [Myxococcota bacterium]|nr:phenylalanine--tRNA ligase subunit beta [Myxococcota bacterium]
MRVSHKWICEIANISAGPEALADRLTMSGLEVEGIQSVGIGYDNIVVAEVMAKVKHPKTANLSVVDVTLGGAPMQVVCGAANCPGPGGRVVFAQPGAIIGGNKVQKKEIQGVTSIGMICSEQELDIGPDGEGILLLSDITDAPPGTPIVDALQLKDAILDVGVTPNRPDALSQRGIAREAALLLGQPYCPKQLDAAPEGGPQIDTLIRVSLRDAGACPRYGVAAVCGVSVKKSPFAIRYRLHTLGVRPISNLVDMTNLILLEYGQPLHAFDLDRLAGGEIAIRKAQPDEKIVTLDEVDRTLTPDDLLICDGERPVAIAGVMGGENTGITDETKNLLIECAYFEPTGIRRTSKRLRLSTESSYRFERGIDPNMGPDVLNAATAMSVALAGGLRSPGTYDCYPKPIVPKVVTLRPARFERIMGVQTSAAEINTILSGLGAAVEDGDKGSIVTVPTARPDIEREIDLIEEVSRIKGLDKVSSVFPRIRVCAKKREGFDLARRAKALFVALGLSEVVTYSFVPEPLLTAMSDGKGIVRMANPLSAERGVMRTTLLPGLFEGLIRARSRFLPGIRQFEVGHTFCDVGGELPNEVLRVAGMLSGPTTHNWIGEDDRLSDFFDAKGIVEAFVYQYAGIAPTFEARSDMAWMHPQKTCQILAAGKPVGFLGELHPTLLAQHKQPPKTSVFEIELEALWQKRRRSRACGLDEFPPVTRDIAMLVDEDQDAGPIVQAFEEVCGPLARDIRLFDDYRAAGIPKEKKSLAFTIVYRSAERTLTEAEVDGIHREAVAQVLSRFGAVQR